MDMLKKLANKFQNKLAQKMSAQPVDIERALGDLYNTLDPFFNAIDAVGIQDSILFDVYLTVGKNGLCLITLKGNHPKTSLVQKNLGGFARQLTSVLQDKKVFPADTMEVPGTGKPWHRSVGYK